MRLILLVCGVLCMLAANAQSAEDSVKQVISDFFMSMKRSDSSGIRATLSPAVHFETIQTKPDASFSPKQESITDFLSGIARTPAGALDERIRFDLVRVDGPLAIVWTPYEFYYNDKYSHCGVNSFQLVRIQDKWLIQYVIDTRRKQCDLSK